VQIVDGSEPHMLLHAIDQKHQCGTLVVKV
jgi:hypothetical protein